jgi:hypothetical protein
LRAKRPPLSGVPGQTSQPDYGSFDQQLIAVPLNCYWGSADCAVAHDGRVGGTRRHARNPSRRHPALEGTPVPWRSRAGERSRMPLAGRPRRCPPQPRQSPRHWTWGRRRSGGAHGGRPRKPTRARCTWSVRAGRSATGTADTPALLYPERCAASPSSARTQLRAGTVVGNLIGRLRCRRIALRVAVAPEASSRSAVWNAAALPTASAARAAGTAAGRGSRRDVRDPNGRCGVRRRRSRQPWRSPSRASTWTGATRASRTARGRGRRRACTRPATRRASAEPLTSRLHAAAEEPRRRPRKP